MFKFSNYPEFRLKNWLTNRTYINHSNYMQYFTHCTHCPHGTHCMHCAHCTHCTHFPHCMHCTHCLHCAHCPYCMHCAHCPHCTVCTVRTVRTICTVRTVCTGSDAVSIRSWSTRKNYIWCKYATIKGTVLRDFKNYLIIYFWNWKQNFNLYMANPFLICRLFSLANCFISYLLDSSW